LIPTKEYTLPEELLSERRSKAEAEARKLVEQFKPHMSEWSGKLRKLGRTEYESQHWRVRVCLFGGKPVGYLIKQRENSVEEVGTIKLPACEGRY
jgi:hypothetical protein